MTPERDSYFDGIRRLAGRERTETVRRPYSSARRIEATVDSGQLTIRNTARLRILEAGNGASVGDIGKFWFVPGYSEVGGPDIIPDDPI